MRENFAENAATKTVARYGNNSNGTTLIISLMKNEKRTASFRFTVPLNLHFPIIFTSLIRVDRSLWPFKRNCTTVSESFTGTLLLVNYGLILNYVSRVIVIMLSLSLSLCNYKLQSASFFFIIKFHSKIKLLFSSLGDLGHISAF